MVSRTVLDNGHSVPVEYYSARSGNLLDPDPVILGLEAVGFALEHLKMPKPNHIDHHQQQHNGADQDVLLLERNRLGTFPVYEPESVELFAFGFHLCSNPTLSAAKSHFEGSTSDRSKRARL